MQKYCKSIAVLIVVASVTASTSVVQAIPDSVSGSGSGPPADQARENTPEAQICDPAGTLDGLEWVRGGPIELQQGQVYVIEFWATWCAPCIMTIPHLTELQEKFRDRSVTFVGVSYEPKSTIEPFIVKMGSKMDYAVASDPHREVFTRYMKAYRQGGIPTAFVVDKELRVAWVGHPMSDLETVVEEVVDETFDGKAYAAKKELVQKQRATRDALYAVAQTGDLEELRRRIAEGINVDTRLGGRWWDGSTLLHYAAYEGNLDMARFLIDSGADVNAETQDGRTPVAVAMISRGPVKKEVVELLVEEGANVPDLHLAAFKGAVRELSNLTEGGADIDTLDKCGSTALHVAANFGSKDVAESLIRQGIDIDRKNILGIPALYYAAAQSDQGVADLLLAAGADINARVDGGSGHPTLVHYAILSKHSNAAKLLIRNGADVNLRNDRSRAPLSDLCASKTYLNQAADILALFLSRGADPNVKDGVGDTPLYRAAQCSNEQIGRLLLDAGADIHARNANGRTPLNKAATYGHIPVMELLISRGADLEAKDIEGRTPLYYAAAYGHANAVKLLISKGAHVGARTDTGDTILYRPAGEGHLDVVELLVSEGLDTNSTNQAGQTALHTACNYGHTSIAEFLIRNGADINARDGKGQTPLHLATGNGHQETADLLIGKSSDMQTLEGKGHTPPETGITVGLAPTEAGPHLWATEDGGNGHSYQHVCKEAGILWQDAKEEAYQFGGYLATITSQGENMHAFGILSRDRRYWNYFDDAQWGPWLGGLQRPDSQEPGRGWEWITGEPFVYTAWGPTLSGTWMGKDENRAELGFMHRNIAKPVWNDVSDQWSLSSGRNPRGYLLEYDATFYEAEENTTVAGGSIEDEHTGFTGKAYVDMGRQAGNSIEMVIPVGPSGPRRMYVRYTNGTDHAVNLTIQVNEQTLPNELGLTPTGGWDAWSVASLRVPLAPGENRIKMTNSTDGDGPGIDSITVIDNNTNLVLYKPIKCSSQEDGSPVSHVVDADPRTVWVVREFPQWLEVDLGGVYPMGRTQLLCLPGMTSLFKVESRCSLDEAYSIIVDRTSENAGGPHWQDKFEEVPGRYVRLTLTGIPENLENFTSLGIAEFRVQPAEEWPVETGLVKQDDLKPEWTGESYSPLSDAVKANDLTAVRRYLNGGTDIEQR